MKKLSDICVPRAVSNRTMYVPAMGASAMRTSQPVTGPYTVFDPTGTTISGIVRASSKTRTRKSPCVKGSPPKLMTRPPMPCHAHPLTLNRFSCKTGSSRNVNKKGDTVGVNVSVGPVGVAVGVFVGVTDGVNVMDGVNVIVGVSVMVAVAVADGVNVNEGVGVSVRVNVGVNVGGKGVVVAVGVAEGVMGVAVGNTDSVGTSTSSDGSGGGGEAKLMPTNTSTPIVPSNANMEMML